MKLPFYRFDFDFTVFVVDIEREVVAEFFADIADFLCEHFGNSIETV